MALSFIKKHEDHLMKKSPIAGLCSHVPKILLVTRYGNIIVQVRPDFAEKNNPTIPTDSYVTYIFEIIERLRYRECDACYFQKDDDNDLWLSGKIEHSEVPHAQKDFS